MLNNHLIIAHPYFTLDAPVISGCHSGCEHTEVGGQLKVVVEEELDVGSLGRQGVDGGPADLEVLQGVGVEHRF